MEFSRQESWCGLPFPPPGDLPDPAIKPRSREPQADSLPSEPPEKPLGENPLPLKKHFVSTSRASPRTDGVSREAHECPAPGYPTERRWGGRSNGCPKDEDWKRGLSRSLETMQPAE